MTKKAEARAEWTWVSRFLGDGPEQGIHLTEIEAGVLQQILAKSPVGGSDIHSLLMRPAHASYDGLTSRWTVVVDARDQEGRWAVRFSAINPPWQKPVPRLSNVVDFWGNLVAFRRDLVLVRTLHLNAISRPKEPVL